MQLLKKQAALVHRATSRHTPTARHRPTARHTPTRACSFCSPSSPQSGSLIRGNGTLGKPLGRRADGQDGRVHCVLPGYPADPKLLQEEGEGVGALSADLQPRPLPLPAEASDSEARWAPSGRGSQGAPNQMKPLSETSLWERPSPGPGRANVSVALQPFEDRALQRAGVLTRFTPTWDATTLGKGVSVGLRISR